MREREREREIEREKVSRGGLVSYVAVGGGLCLVGSPSAISVCVLYELACSGSFRFRVFVEIQL